MKLTAAARARIPQGKFGIVDPRTGKGKYPVEDASHARNALSRVSQQENKGNISAAEAAKVRAKANAELKKG